MLSSSSTTGDGSPSGHTSATSSTFSFLPSGYLVGKVTPDGVEHYREWHPELEKFVEGNYVGFQPHLAGVLGVYSWWGP